MKRCSFCAESIQDDAIFCKHCREDLVHQQSRVPANVGPVPSGRTLDEWFAEERQKPRPRASIGQAVQRIGTVGAVVVGLIVLLGIIGNRNRAPNGSLPVDEITTSGGSVVRPRESSRDRSDQNVAKKDGSYDERPNDLTELCKDYLFYRKRIMKMTAAGDEAGAAKARQSFQQINRWLSDYPETEVQNMFSRLGAEGL